MRRSSGLALRLAFALLYWVDQPLTHDEREYLALGAQRGARRRVPAIPPTSRARDGAAVRPRARLPAVPRGARRHRRPRQAPRRVQIAQAFVGALGIWLIAAIAGRAAGPRAAVAAAAIAAVYPPLVWMPAYVLSETLFSTLALARGAGAHAEDRGSGVEVDDETAGPLRDPRISRPRSLGGVLTGARHPHASRDAVLPATRGAVVVADARPATP